jgi:hypothetical protein
MALRSRISTMHNSCGDALLVTFRRSRAGLGYSRKLKLPSWVPDWTCAPKVRAFSYLAGSSGYHATPGTTSIVEEGEQKGTLMIHGLLLDSIFYLSSERVKGADVDYTSHITQTVAWIEEV